MDDVIKLDLLDQRTKLKMAERFFSKGCCGHILQRRDHRRVYSAPKSSDPKRNKNWNEKVNGLLALKAISFSETVSSTEEYHSPEMSRDILSQSDRWSLCS